MFAHFLLTDTLMEALVSFSNPHIRSGDFAERKEFHLIPIQWKPMDVKKRNASRLIAPCHPSAQKTWQINWMQKGV